MTTVEMGTCPACEGSGREPVREESRRYLKYNAKWRHWGIAGYEPAGPGPFTDGQGYEGGTLPCRNCGGQTMSLRGTGKVPLREDGTPCVHEVELLPGSNPRRGYHRYGCKWCSFKYVIDSGD